LPDSDCPLDPENDLKTGETQVALTSLLLSLFDQRPEFERLRRAEMCTDRITTAQIALDEYVMNIVIECTSERACRRARRTLDTFVLIKLDRAGFLVE
jgi:hypothetical protein